MVSYIKQRRMATTSSPNSVEQLYLLPLITLSVILIIFHPVFHLIFRYVPNIPPDTLSLRLISMAVSAVVLLIVVFPAGRRYADWLQVVNVGTVMIVVHQLVLNTGNHPLYLATSLTGVYTAQLACVRLREWLLTTVFIFGWHIIAFTMQGGFSTW